jgi:hypothetical protein
MADPWLKFYPQDWRADERLRNCGLAARGLWMEMLALMHRSERYGYLLINGKAPSVQQLAVQAGSIDDITPLLAELEEHAVFSRDRNGTIYSRRMIRDEKRAIHARKIGKKGGNPKLGKQTGNSAQDNGQDKRGDNGVVKPHMPEARSQNHSEGKPSGAEPLQIDPVKELFDLGVAILTEAGMGEREARSMVGKWRKERGPGETLTALLECQAQRISEPVEWLTKRLQKAHYVSKSGYEYRGDEDAILREAERRNDMDTYWSIIGEQKRRAVG